MERRESILCRLGHIWAGALLLIFVANYANITLFGHYHVVDGVTIVHSHFHTADHTNNEDNGGHSSNELTLIKILSNFVAVAQSSQIEIDRSVSDLHVLFSVKSEPAIAGELYSLPLLRAPPTDSLIG
ncbi:MAG: hypothetical protein R3Y16_00785 [Rikenellaceae bacterium]